MAMFNVLTLTNFRNHECARINSDGAKNIIITGPNGSGKTAILEAVSMLSGNGGMRGAAMPEIARINGNGGFSVHSVLDNDTELSISYENGDSGRKLRINGDSAPLSNAPQNVRMVWLTPKEDRLFAESASDRRAFFDRLVNGLNPSHSGHVARMGKLLSERAFALKSSFDSKWLDTIEKQLAGIAASVAAARVAYGARLNHFLESETDARIVLSGWFESRLLDNGTSIDTEKEYMDYLLSNRQIIADKMVIDGAHKSDFSMFRNDLNMNADMLSAGQQKKLLMLLIIAHAKLLGTNANTPIIILLDEAASHLDEISRTDLFNRLDLTPAQVWVTGADIETFKNIKNSLFVSCADGAPRCKLGA